MTEFSVPSGMADIVHGLTLGRVLPWDRSSHNQFPYIIVLERSEKEKRNHDSPPLSMPFS